MRKQTPSAAVYGEVGRYHLLVLRKIAIIKYWKKIKACSYTLLYNVFNMKDAHGNIVNTFHKDINNFLDSLGLSYMHMKLDITNSDVELVIGQIKDSYIQTWFSDLDNSAKLQCYRSFKSYFEPEKLYRLC